MTNTNLSIGKNPYTNETVSRIYNMLFCDGLEIYKTPDINDKYPWSTLFSPTATPEELKAIIDQPNVETRPKILAYRKLAQIGKPLASKNLLGIIVEVALDEGLDTLAAYKDGTARYINHSEKIIIWDTPTDESKRLSDEFFREGEIIVTKIGPWEKPRLPAPEKGNVRITLLVCDQLYFGEGPMEILFNDPIGEKALGAATMLMKYLTETTGLS